MTNTVTDTDRAELIVRIKAIQARTESNGCTEAEAMQAAEMLTRLLTKYHLTMTDVEIGGERCMTQYVETGRRALHEVQYCLWALARATDTKCWIWRAPINQGGAKKIAWFGLPADVEMAVYLTGAIKAAMDRELASWRIRARAVGDETGRSSAHSFLIGMASRVSERLMQIKANDRASTVAATGRDLVVVKGAVVTFEFAKL